MVHATQKVVAGHDGIKQELKEHRIANLFVQQIAESTFAILGKQDLRVDEAYSNQSNQKHEGVEHIRYLSGNKAALVCQKERGYGKRQLKMRCFDTYHIAHGQKSSTVEGKP